MRALRDKLRRRDDGFTITEVMAALLIFALMSTGSIFATMSMLQITRDARNRQVAANLAAQEIDTVRSYADATAVVDRAFDPPAQNGTEFHVDRAVSWQSIPVGDDEGEGCTLAPMRFVAAVTVTVTWKGMRPQTAPVTSDTLLTARDLQTDDNAGTVAVTVLGADGTGRSGVRVQGGGVSVVTDTRGRAVLVNVPTGVQTVSVEKPGYVDEKQDPRPKKDTMVSAGSCTEVQFQYDETTRANVYYAANYIMDYGQRPYVLFPSISSPPVGTVRAFAELQATFSNPATGDYAAVMPTTNTMVGGLDLHPFASGYTVYAGDCDTADPVYWGAPALAPFAITPGGEAEVYVPMGVVVLDTHGGSPNEIRAKPVDPASNQDVTPTDMRGCSTLQYSFGSADGYTITGTAALALPYGSWIITYSDGGGQGSVPQSWLTGLDLPAEAGRGLPAVQTTTAKRTGDVIVTVRPVVP
ncbi:MAG: prepilin-type N-terminal cleavage/methylation domain-containing protein [Micrococcales bacterium]|nr:prepilin-type N-terminal cleavage/methylation domain-containing protein [Micrococcales bacterium]